MCVQQLINAFLHYFNTSAKVKLANSITFMTACVATCSFVLQSFNVIKTGNSSYATSY